LRSIGILIALVLFATLALSVYFTFFVDGPEDIVQSFVEAYNEMDLSSIVKCIEPKYEKMYTAISNITLGFGGVGTSLGDILSFSPLLASAKTENGEHNLTISMDNVSVNIKGAKIKKFKDMVKVDIKSVEKLLGDTAEVSAILTLSTGAEVEVDKVVFKLKKYSSDGWRIVDIVNIN